MSDKQTQQRRGRADGPIGCVAERSAVEGDRALASETAQESPWWPPVDRESPCAGRDSPILRSGARWQDLPEEYPHPSTCWRRLRDWEEQGIWLKVWRAFLSELNERQQLKWSESFLDGSFAPAKKGAAESEKPSGARGRSGWWWSTAAVFLWESTFTLHPRRKSGSRKRHSRRSG
jgi:hypothetical protein